MDPLTPTNKPIPPLDPLTPSPTHFTTSPTARPSPETPTKSRNTPTYADLALKCESLKIGWEQQEKQLEALREQQEKQLKALGEQQEKQLETLAEQQGKQLEALREQQEEQQKSLRKENGLLLRKLGRVLSTRKGLRVRLQDVHRDRKARDVSRQTNERLLVENKRLQKSLLDAHKSNRRVVSRTDAHHTRLVAALRDELTDLQDQLTTLQSSHTTLQDRADQMLTEGKALLQANTDLAAQLGTANNTIESLHAFIAGLQSYAEGVVREKFEMELLLSDRLRNLTLKQRNWVRSRLEREESGRGRVKELGSWEGDGRRVVERRRSTGEVGLSKGGLRSAVGTLPAKWREVDHVQAEVPGANDLPAPEVAANPPPANQQQSPLSTTAFGFLIALFWIVLFAMVLLAAGTIVIQDHRRIT